MTIHVVFHGLHGERRKSELPSGLLYQKEVPHVLQVETGCGVMASKQGAQLAMASFGTQGRFESVQASPLFNVTESQCWWHRNFGDAIARFLSMWAGRFVCGRSAAVSRSLTVKQVIQSEARFEVAEIDIEPEARNIVRLFDAK